MVGAKIDYDRRTSLVFIRALPALFMVAIILGGILGGVFTPTEASVVAVVYGFFVSFFVYRDLNLRCYRRFFEVPSF